MRLGALSGVLALLWAASCERRVEVIGRGQPPGGDAPFVVSSDAAVDGDVIAGRTVDFALGQAHACAVTNGQIACWGSNTSGEVGDGQIGASQTPRRVGDGDTWRSVTAGSAYSCGLTEDGTVACWGDNGRGELGAGDRLATATPNTVALPGDAQRIAAKYSHACAVLTTGDLWCWGDNREAQLGQVGGFPAPESTIPLGVGVGADWSDVAAGAGHGCALRSGGALWCWGRNTEGQLGLGAASSDGTLPPTQVVGDINFRTIAAGLGATCAISTSGALYCWGENSFGGLGQGDSLARAAPTQVGAYEDWTTIDVNALSTCGVRAPGSLWCWGRNGSGQLGLGDTLDRDEPTRVGTASDWDTVRLGRTHGCALKRDGSLWCTGANHDGRLGLGDTRDRLTLAEVGRDAPR